MIWCPSAESSALVVESHGESRAAMIDIWRIFDSSSAYIKDLGVDMIAGYLSVMLDGAFLELGIGGQSLKHASYF
jgi:hypothetical protein